MVKILIVSDHPVIKQMLKMQIELETGLCVIGEMDRAYSPRVDLVCGSTPDIVIIDLDLQNRDGIEATRQMHAAMPEIPIIVLSMNGNELTRQRAHNSGAAAFVTKQANTHELVNTIRDLVHSES
jgi:DNA-binding NarL/FixJ family response regulator